MFELDMVKDCYLKLKNANDIKAVVLEVPYLSRCIDMVIVDKSNSVITIEFKLKNWRQALKQAEDHSLGADKAYICMPRLKSIPEDLIKETQDKGIGLLFWNKESENPFDEYIAAKENIVKWKPWNDSLKDRINRISGEKIF